MHHTDFIAFAEHGMRRGLPLVAFLALPHQRGLAVDIRLRYPPAAPGANQRAHLLQGTLGFTDTDGTPRAPLDRLRQGPPAMPSVTDPLQGGLAIDIAGRQAPAPPAGGESAHRVKRQSRGARAPSALGDSAGGTPRAALGAVLRAAPHIGGTRLPLLLLGTRPLERSTGIHRGGRKALAAPLLSELAHLLQG